MYFGWTVATVLVVGGGFVAIWYFLSRRRTYAAQLIALAMLVYLIVILLVCGGATDWLAPEGTISFNRDQSWLFLASGGGLLSQCAKWCDRLRQTRAARGSVADVFVDGTIGILCGFVALTIAGAAKGELGKLTDVQAGAAGIVGGWLGLSVFDLVQVWFSKHRPRG